MAATGKVEWDIVSADLEDLPSRREWLYDLRDCGMLPNVAARGVADACHRYALLRTIGSGVIAYNTQKFATGQHPRSWADFWDVQKFPWPRALPNADFAWWVLAAALMADGVSVDELWPLDVDRTFRKLDRIKPHVAVWWKTSAESQQIMRDGEVVMAMTWSGRAINLKAPGLPVDVERNQAIKDVAFWAVLKDAPHRKAALAFLDFFMGRSGAQLAFGRKLFYDTSNRKVPELLPISERPTRATFDANSTRMVDVDVEWVVKSRDGVMERRNAWLAK